MGLAVRTFRTEEEAIESANRSVYGLANAVFSKDEERSARVASQLKSGVVWENCSQPLFMPMPFGGFVGKQSGFGREMGEEGLHEYLNHKTICATPAGYSWNWYGNKQ